MRIAITDACIFIDLMELDLISEFFQMNIEVHTTIEVINELFLQQKQVLEAFESSNILNIHNFEKRDHLKIEEIPFPKGLSQHDRSVIYLAMNLSNAIVLSSDKLVRKFAGKHQLEYHGLIWIFDELVKGAIISKGTAIAKIEKLVTINSMYKGMLFDKELEKRMKDWREE